MDIDLVNEDNLHDDLSARAKQKVYRIWYLFGSCAVVGGYGIDCEQDALDALADWAEENAPGLLGTIDNEETDHVKALRSDAIADGRDGEDYINDYYMRAGNCGNWLLAPEMIEVITFTKYLKMIENA